MTSESEENWVVVPPGGPVEETVVDRRTNRSWTVRVEPFELAAMVVTQQQWQGVLPEPPLKGDHPQICVSWRDAILFCNELSSRQGLTAAYSLTTRSVERPKQWRPHNEPTPDDWIVAWDQTADGYRLPTDAEWQVACRAGTHGARYAPLEDAGWYQGNSGDRLPPVGLKTPNRWGLGMVLGPVRRRGLRLLPHHPRRRVERP